MHANTPLQVLNRLSPDIPDTICYMPPILLDLVSSCPLFIKEEAQKQFATYRGVRDVFDTYLPRFPVITVYPVFTGSPLLK